MRHLWELLTITFIAGMTAGAIGVVLLLDWTVGL